MVITVQELPSSSKKKGDYTWEVRIAEHRVAFGELKGHQRSKGWFPLLRKIVRQIYKGLPFDQKEELTGGEVSE